VVAGAWIAEPEKFADESVDLCATKGRWLKVVAMDLP